MRHRRAVRIAAVVAASLVALAALTVIGYRVFAPAETLTAPTVPYPAVQVITDERPFSELRAAPLVVEDRLRVYAEKWRVWSDAPVGERYESTPYWAFRRWPAQVVGVVTAQTAAGPMVVTQWSDGEIIAIDARQGAIAWRASAPMRPVARTTVAAPARRSSTSRSRCSPSAIGDLTVVVVTGPSTARAFDAADGKPLWQRALPAGCESAAFTGAGIVRGAGLRRPVDRVRRRARRRRAGHLDRAEAGPPAPAAPALCELAPVECRLLTRPAARGGPSSRSADSRQVRRASVPPPGCWAGRPTIAVPPLNRAPSSPATGSSTRPRSAWRPARSAAGIHCGPGRGWAS